MRLSKTFFMYFKTLMGNKKKTIVKSIEKFSPMVIGVLIS